jgi:hypothetical protein
VREGVNFGITPKGAGGGVFLTSDQYMGPCIGIKKEHRYNQFSMLFYTFKITENNFFVRYTNTNEGGEKNCLDILVRKRALTRTCLTGTSPPGPGMVRVRPFIHSMPLDRTLSHWLTYNKHRDVPMYEDSPNHDIQIFPSVRTTVLVPHHDIQIFFWPRKKPQYLCSYNICLIYNMCKVDH